jgi:hypothetical protein
MMVELKSRELRGHLNSKAEGNPDPSLAKGRSRDYSERKYIQADGSARLVKKDLTIFDNDDIVHSIKKLIAEDKMICKRCGEEKNIIDFPVCSKKKNGENYYRKVCKVCYCDSVHKWNKENNDKHNANARKSYMNHKDETLHKVKVYRMNNPQKKHAVNLINSNIRSGSIIRLKSCEICGNGGNIQGHHPDYNEPLRVVWVCVSCHRKIHLALGQSLAKVAE